MNRKIVSAVLIFMMLFSIVSPAFAAEDDNTLVVSVTDAVVDLDQGVTSVQVDVVFDENPGVYAVNFALEYDETVMTYAGATNNHASFDVQSNPSSKQILVKGLRQKDYTDTGAITTLTFNLKENCKAGSYEIKLVQIADKAVVSCYEVGKVVDAQLGSGVVTIAPKIYTVKVNGGIADVSKAVAGATVAITAEVPEGKEFVNWTGDVEFADANAAATTFTMPANNVTVTANFKDKVYAVTVKGGSANVEAAVAGATVEITAEVPEGKEFAGWTGDVTFANAKAAKTTFVMPAKAVTVTANFEDKAADTKKYEVIVVNGTASSAKAAEGETVTITAAPAPAGKTFDKWLVLKGDMKLANENAAETTFVMPGMDAEVEARYKTKSSGGPGGGGAVIVKPEPKPEPKQNVIILTIGENIVKVNDKDVVCDVAPLIKDGRTYTPARFVAEQLGAKVTWDEAKQLVTVTEGDIVIELTIGSNVAKVNGKAVEMDAAAFIRNGRTYTPARFVAEQLGAKVAWNETSRQVTITETIEA